MSFGVARHEIYTNASNKQLRALLVGKEEVASIYESRLAPLFDELQHEALCVARELVKHWIGEERKHAPVLKSPDMVQVHLRIVFRDQEHELFVRGDGIAVTGSYLLPMLFSAPVPAKHDGDAIFRICKSPINQNSSFCKEQAAQM